MKIPANYHTHSRFDDGQGEPEDYVQVALDRGLTHLGFSGHSPLPFPTSWNMKEENFEAYKASILELKKRYAGKIEILFGLEVDFLPGLMSVAKAEEKFGKFDYTIGSVHFLGELQSGKQWTVDGPREEFEAGLKESFKGNVRALVEGYYERVIEMLETAVPSIVGHFDLVKKSNYGEVYFSEKESWYREAVERALDAVKRSGAVLEVNTGGLARNTSCALYPSEWILERCAKLNIPVVVNSDAHRPDYVDALLTEQISVLRTAGFEQVCLLTGNGWESVRIG